MATQYDPIAKDESLNTTEVTPRNIADVLAEELSAIEQAIAGGSGSTVAWTQIQQTGTKIAEIDINGASQDVFVPTAPTVNDGVLTIQQDGTTVGTFSANQSGNTTVNLTGGSGSGGHTIVNASGTDMTQRAKLWFADAKVTDDSTEQATKVEVVQLIDDESELTNAPDGVYQGDYDDAPEDVLDASMVAYNEGSVKDALDGLNLGSVSITADGTETYNTLLNSFFALIDESKLSPTSYLTFQNQIYRVVDISVGYRHIFIRSYFGVSDGKSQNWQIELRPSLSTLVQQNGDGNIINYSSAPPNVGDTFTLYY